MKGKDKLREATVIRFQDLLPRDSVKGGQATGKLVFGLRRPESGNHSPGTPNISPKRGEGQ